MPLNYNAITALTKNRYIPKLIDAIFKSTPLLTILRDREDSYDGGPKIVQPLIYGELSNVVSYDGYDTITYDTSIPITAAEYTPKNIVAPFIIAKTEELTNMGDNQVIALVEAKMRILELTLKKQFSAQLYGDGTGNGGKDLTGLALAVSDAGIYGGIDRGAYAWWKSLVNTDAAPRALANELLLKMWLGLTDGDDQPDIILSGPKTWGAYSEYAENRVTIQTDMVKKMLASGFQTLEYMGRPVVYDNGCPEGKFFFLNSKYLHLRPHSAANFAHTDFRRDDTRVARKMEILWTGNLTCSNSAKHGILDQIDYSTFA